MHPMLGIDIGKAGFVAAFLPDDPKTSPRQWRSILKIDYADPLWWRTLLDLIAPNGVVAAEPTGHHLLAPVAAVLRRYQPHVQVWQVDHKLTAAYRNAHVSAAKNDRLDAIALCLIAADIAAGQPPRGVRLYDHHHESAVQALRMLVNQHRGVIKESTRLKNRLNVHAHSLYPSFAGSNTWLRALQHGAASPRQLREFAALETPYADGRMTYALRKLTADLPDIDGDPATIDAAYDLANQLALVTARADALEAEIERLISAPPFATVTRRWRTLPAAGTITLAALHVATHGLVQEFTKDEFTSAVGVSPTTSTSGAGDRTRTTARGYRPIKTLLHLWAMALLSPNMPENPVRTYYQQRERPFAAARTKLARVLWGVARNAALDKAE